MAAIHRLEIIQDLTTILGVEDWKNVVHFIPVSSMLNGYIPRQKDKLHDFIQGNPFCSIFSIEKNNSMRKWEIKIVFLTREVEKMLGNDKDGLYGDSESTENQLLERFDAKLNNNRYSDRIKSKMIERLESYITVCYRKGASNHEIPVTRYSLMNLFVEGPIFTCIKPIISLDENKYDISIYIEQQREATESEELIELSVWFGDTKIHVIDMTYLTKLRKDLVSHSLLLWADVCHSHDTRVENLLNSTRAYINRAIDNIQFVVPVDIPDEYRKRKAEQLSDNYSFIAFFFTLTNLMSFSGLRTCLTQFNNTTESIQRFHELYRISKQFRGAITLMRKYDKNIYELFQLWTIPGGKELDSYNFVKYLDKIKHEKLKINQDDHINLNFNKSVITLNPFPFRTRRSTKLNDNLSGKEIDFKDGLNCKRVIYNMYETMLFIISKKRIKEIKEQSYNINNFSGQSTNDSWKIIEKRNKQKEEPTNSNPLNISSTSNNSIHQSLDELVNEARNELSSLIENYCLGEITFEIMNYTFTPVEIPDDLPDKIFVIDKISQLRYKNIIQYYRTIQKLSFDCQHQNSNDPIWRAFIHLDLLITFFEFLVSALVRARQFSNGNKKTILNITCLIEDLYIIINSCIDDTCSTYQLDLPIAIECNQDLLFKKLIKKELEWKELSRFTNRYATECSLLENLQLFNIFSNCYPELIEMCKNSSIH